MLPKSRAGSRQPNFTVVAVDYNQMVVDPLPHVLAVNRLLGGHLDMERMAAVVQPTLITGTGRGVIP